MADPMEDTAELIQEIERKFLVDDDADLPSPLPAGDAIQQGYLALEPDGTEVRIRLRSDKFFLTIKSPGSLVRSETEIELTRRQFDLLWPATAGRRVEKVRHCLPWQGHTIELDVYGGGLGGLRTAEVEFASVRASRAFEPPPWLGREITGDPRYKNRNLALEGRPETSEGGDSS